MSPIIEVAGLTKKFKTVTAVEDLSFNVEAGDIFGFLGQNGAGKSTTMRMMLGLVRPDAGSIKIKGTLFNEGHRHLLKHVGAIIERPDMYGYLSGLDNLRIFARLSGIPVDMKRIDALLELVGLKGREHDKFKTYSQGMKQRLGIAIALVHDPDILMLDEPSNGLDPQGIADMRNLIIHLSRDLGKTIIISSHLLYEVEQMATRMMIVHHGRKMVEGAVRELLKPADTLMEVIMESNNAVAGSIQKDPQWQGYLQEANSERLLLKMSRELVPELTRWLVRHDANVRSMSARHSLEAYFLSLTHDRDHVATAAY